MHTTLGRGGAQFDKAWIFAPADRREACDAGRVGVSNPSSQVTRKAARRTVFGEAERDRRSRNGDTRRIRNLHDVAFCGCRIRQRRTWLVDDMHLQRRERNAVR